MRILRFAFRIFGLFALTAGLSASLGHLLGWFDATALQLTIYFIVAAIFLFSRPARLGWVWVASLSPAIMGFAAAYQIDVMFAFVGVLFSVFGTSVWVGTRASLIYATGCFALLGLGMTAGVIDYSEAALNRMPVYYLAVTCMTLCLGLVMNSLNRALAEADELTHGTQKLNEQLSRSLDEEHAARQEAARTIEELRQVQTELNASVENLRQARYDLETKTLKQQEIFAIIGHELRTPAAAIELIANDPDHLIDNQRLLATASNQMLRVLDDMGEIIRPGQDRPLQTEPVDLMAQLDSLSIQLHTLLAQRKMKLEIEVLSALDPEVITDPVRLNAILSNTVRNACLHSAGSLARVSVRSNALGLTLLIEDDGRGIPEQLRERVLEPWERGEQQHPGSGTGLGLSIAQRAVIELGGTIKVQDSELGGACIKVFLPRIAAPEQPTHDESAKDFTAQMAKWSLTIVDDDEIMRHLIRREYEPLFKAVSLFMDGQDALGPLLDRAPDVLITDHFMPGMSGVELISRLRSQGYTGIIIGTTGAALFEGEHPMITAGADSLIIKPMTLDLLTSTLRDLQRANPRRLS